MTISQADNITMSGGGLYSLATRGAKDVIDRATPRVLDALAALDDPPANRGFQFADMGCADGGTSLDMVRKLVGSARQRWKDLPITVLYADQPANDFNALVSIVHGRSQFDSWLGEVENARALFSGNSFYLQAVADGCLDLAFSATAMHWLSQKPGNIPDHVHMVGATGDALESFSDQARSDWERILLCRAAELRPGGRAVFANFCRDEHGRYLGNTGGVNMFDTFNALWCEFRDAGRISAQEYQNMTLPQYYRTVEEFSAPLTDLDNPVHQAGLRLDSIETGVVNCPFARAYEADGDLEAFADGLIPTIRSWNQSIFAAGLDSSRDADERVEIIEDYYGAYRQRVLNDPTGHGMDYVHAYMTISKAQ